jgi:uncharacterized protein YukE
MAQTGLGQTASAVLPLLNKADASVQATVATSARLNSAVETLMNTFRGDTAVATGQVHQAIYQQQQKLVQHTNELNAACKQHIQTMNEHDQRGGTTIGNIAGQVHNTPAAPSGTTLSNMA